MYIVLHLTYANWSPGCLEICHYLQSCKPYFLVWSATGYLAAEECRAPEACQATTNCPLLRHNHWQGQKEFSDPLASYSVIQVLAHLSMWSFQMGQKEVLQWQAHNSNPHIWKPRRIVATLQNQFLFTTTQRDLNNSRNCTIQRIELAENRFELSEDDCTNLRLPERFISRKKRCIHLEAILRTLWPIYLFLGATILLQIDFRWHVMYLHAKHPLLHYRAKFWHGFSLFSPTLPTTDIKKKDFCKQKNRSGE